MTVGHAMSFAKLRERVRGCAYARVHVRKGVESGRKTRRARRDKAEQKVEQSRIYFVKERGGGGEKEKEKAVSPLRALYMIYEYTGQIVNKKKNLQRKRKKEAKVDNNMYVTRK